MIIYIKGPQMVAKNWKFWAEYVSGLGFLTIGTMCNFTRAQS